MARFFVGDLHLGHAKVSQIRGFENTDVHDAMIMKQLHSLHKDDEVWVFGDISSGRPEAEDRAIELLSEVQATLHLISGNHDSCSSIHRDGHKKQEKFRKAFASIQDFHRFRIFGTQVLASHYPYARSGDGTNREGARYLEYRLPDMGFPLLHAHTHQESPHMRLTKDISRPDEARKLVSLEDQQQFCVSWDVMRKPVTEAEITEWIQEFRKLPA